MENDEMNFSTQWGVLSVFPDGNEHYSDTEDRASAERIVENMNKSKVLKAELVWRGVTPWIKALI